jgi:hypothetical protein
MEKVWGMDGIAMDERVDQSKLEPYLPTGQAGKVVERVCMDGWMDCRAFLLPSQYRCLHFLTPGYRVQSTVSVLSWAGC